MNDICNLSLTNVDLMVLSGCQAAVSTLNLGRNLGDDVEILGFGYQVQNAGGAAIASWSMDNGGTEVLMSQFYALLQQVQIALIRSEEHIQLQDTLIRRRNLGNVPQLDAQQLAHPYY